MNEKKHPFDGKPPGYYWAKLKRPIPNVLPNNVWSVILWNGSNMTGVIGSAEVVDPCEYFDDVEYLGLTRNQEIYDRIRKNVS
jgi:hypothetical protein